MADDIRWVRIDVLLAVHERMLAEHGGAHGARFLFQRDPTRVHGVPVDDPGIPLDLGTPAAYKAALRAAG